MRESELQQIMYYNAKTQLEELIISRRNPAD
jgi:hypothetical protein